MTTLVRQHEIEAPEGMVERETAAVLDELLMTLRATGGRLEGLSDDPEVLKATARETATRRIKESLLLEAVARQENLTVTDEEIEAEIQTLARLYRQEPSALRTSLEDPVRRAGLMGRILERKALDFLMAQATISEAYHLIKPA
jgi:trigger factor